MRVPLGFSLSQREVAVAGTLCWPGNGRLCVRRLIYAPKPNDIGDVLLDRCPAIEVSTALGQTDAVCSSAVIAVLHDLVAEVIPDLMRLFRERGVPRTCWTV